MEPEVKGQGHTVMKNVKNVTLLCLYVCLRSHGYVCLYRRLISKSAFMQFWAILTFLHIWKNESQGYLKKHGPWQFLKNKGSNCPLKSGTGAKNAVAI